VLILHSMPFPFSLMAWSWQRLTLLHVPNIPIPYSKTVARIVNLPLSHVHLTLDLISITPAPNFTTNFTCRHGIVTFFYYAPQ